MGEWNRARAAIHDATSEEAREAAIDHLWRLASDYRAERILAAFDQAATRLYPEQDAPDIVQLYHRAVRALMTDNMDVEIL